MLLSAVARPGLLMLLWQRPAAALIAHWATTIASGTRARGVGTLPEARLRDLGLDWDQVGRNVALAKCDHWRLL